MKDVIRKTEELQYEVQQLRHSDGILSQNYEHLVTDVLQLYLFFYSLFFFFVSLFLFLYF